MAIRYTNTHCQQCHKDRRGNVYKNFASPFCRSCSAHRMWKRRGKKPSPICKRCGKKFKYRRSSDAYCNNRCQSNLVTKTCEVCGKTFSVPASNADRYLRCSAKCRKVVCFSVVTNCRKCGKPFKHQKDEKRRHCSTACYRRSRAETGIEERTRLLLESFGIPYVQEFPIRKRDVFDFYLPLHNALIECDGTYWHSTERAKLRDKRKTDLGILLGYHVIRFSEDEINAPTFSMLLRKTLKL